MREVTLPTGDRMPALGLGTWKMGEAPRQQAAEVAAVRLALEMGYRLIDTAEMYGEGGAETVVGQALAEALRAGAVARQNLFIVSKVYPHNASRAGVQAACERSLRRLGLDQLDLYLLHWRGGEPLADTLAGFETLQQRGLIRHWGVSNFDLDDLEELATLPGGAACAANQVYYSLSQRGIEFDVSPWQRRQRMPVMAYSPIDQGALAAQPGLDAIARRLQATPAQVALAWLAAQPGTIAIPKAVREAHLRENLAAADLQLSPDDLAQLDALFPPPRRKQPLAML
ncbi:MAG: aldo/keto reductase [Aquincola sp.]|nr:aldo/keto reductase [Aquincola sp.]